MGADRRRLGSEYEMGLVCLALRLRFLAYFEGEAQREHGIELSESVEIAGVGEDRAFALRAS